MSETILDIPHFSKKLMGLSLLLVAIHFAFLGVKSLQQPVPAIYSKVAPQVAFVGTEGVEIKTIFDSDFRRAKPEETVQVGTAIRTDGQSFAQIVLLPTVLRLDPGTELKLTANDFEVASLTFELLRGGVWVKARDPVFLSTARSAALFFGAFGYYRLEGALHQVSVIRGGADLTLKKENGEALTAFFIPPRHEVRFSESQITLAYSKLQPSKLKKELKLSLISGAEKDPWVMRQIEGETAEFNHSPSFAFLNFFWDPFLRLRSRLAFNSKEANRVKVQALELQLDFLLSLLQKSPDPEKRDSAMKRLSGLIESPDPVFLPVVSRVFRQVAAFPSSSPLYVLKEALRQYLVRAQKNPVLFRTYLTDLEHDLDLEKHLEITTLELWQKLWDESFLQSFYPEFERQWKTLFGLILAHPEQMSLELFTALNPLEEIILKHSPDFAETLFGLLDFKLDFSGILLGVSHASLAQTVLRSAYTLFDQNASRLQDSGREVFLSRAELLLQQIDFIRTELHGSAEGFDEAAFRQYRERKARDESLTKTLESLLKGEEEEVALAPPTREEVMIRFAQARISVIEENLEPNAEDPFSFLVREARLIDRGVQGGLITFSAVYDYRTNAVHDIQVKGKPMSGNFSLQDLAAVLTRRETPATQETNDLLALTEDPDRTGEEGNLRSQAVARDMASQLLLEEFRKTSIGIAGPDAFELIDPSDLNEFKINEAAISLPLSGQIRRVAFAFRLDRHEAMDIRLLDGVISLPGPLALARLAEAVETALGNARANDQAERDVYEFLRSEGFSLASKDLIPEGGNRFRFEHLKFQKVPLEIAGVYDKAVNSFPELQHELFSATDTSLESYLNELVPRFLVAFLAERGVTPDPATVQTVYPFLRLQVKGFKAGKSLLDFDVNVAGNRLEQVSIQGEETAVPTMAFEEFKSILKTFETEAAD